MIQEISKSVIAAAETTTRPCMHRTCNIERDVLLFGIGLFHSLTDLPQIMVLKQSIWSGKKRQVLEQAQ